jgi:hypothetical protein
MIRTGFWRCPYRAPFASRVHAAPTAINHNPKTPKGLDPPWTDGPTRGDRPRCGATPFLAVWEE